jgi:hypothetical protein
LPSTFPATGCSSPTSPVRSIPPNLDGKNPRNFLYAQGNLTGIAYAEI